MVFDQPREVGTLRGLAEALRDVDPAARTAAAAGVAQVVVVTQSLPGERGRQDVGGGIWVMRVGLAGDRRAGRVRRVALALSFAVSAALHTVRYPGATVVVSTNPPFLPVLAAFGPRRGRRRIAMILDLYPHVVEEIERLPLPQVTGRLWNRAHRHALRRYEQVFVVGEPMRAALERSTGVASRVLPLWTTEADPPAVPEPRVPEPGAGAGTTVLYAGNLGVVHDHQGLLAVLDGLLRRRPDTEVVVAGYGGKRPALEASFASCPPVTFRPYLSPAELDAEHRRARLVLVVLDPRVRVGATSSRVITAWRHGVPVVAVAAAGSNLAHLVQDAGGGIVCPPDDPGATVDSIVTLLTDAGAASALGQAGRRAFLARHRVHSVAEALLDVDRRSPAAPR